MLLPQSFEHCSSSTGKMCIISMDEISLKSHLFYGCSKGKVIGLEDLVDGTTSNQLATSAIVLMTPCPLPSQGITQQRYSQEELTDATNKLENIGLNVLGVVSYIGSNFQKFVRKMGIINLVNPSTMARRYDTSLMHPTS